jgi:hypothetical protein
VQAGWSTVRFVDSVNSCHLPEVEEKETAVQAGWSTVRFVDSVNSCHLLEVEGEGDSCASRLVNSALC